MTQSTQDTPPSAPNQGVGFGYLSIVAIVFILGGAVGFLVRPAVVGDTLVEVVVTATPDPDNEAVTQNEPSGNAEPEAAPDNTPPTPTIMEFVLADVRHFQGNADAPVTIVEFSDFK